MFVKKVWEKISAIFTLWAAVCGKVKTLFSLLTFGKQVSKELFSRNFFSMRVNVKCLVFLHFAQHSVKITEIYSHAFLAKLLWNNDFAKDYRYKLIWRNIFLVFKRKFFIFPECTMNFDVTYWIQLVATVWKL